MHHHYKITRTKPVSALFRLLIVLVTVLAAVPVPAQTTQEAHGVIPVDPNAIRVLLSPELETILVAQMAGSIVTLNASLGSSITKGNTIVAFDCREGSAKLRMAEAEFASARETLQTKKRLRALDAAGDLEVSLAAAAADRTKAAIAVGRAQLSQCTITAPFSGRIVKVYVKPFQGVNTGTPIVEMISEGPLKIRLNVPSTLLRTLQVGTPLEVDIDETGKTYRAKVTAINARVDAVSQTVELEASIDSHPEELLAGMTGIARFHTNP
jgi:RND family efflux transporter MFP subunit